MPAVRFSCLILLIASLASCQSVTRGTGQGDGHNWLKPSENDQELIQSALLNVQPGDTIFLGEGIFQFTNTVSLDGIEHVTMLGKGMNKTVFSFKDQTEGAEGLRVTANHFTIQDMAIENPKGDGIKVQGADGVVFRRLRVEWTNKADSTNGAYGLYPVSSKNILMEECVAIGASDAGIYLGQSENGIIRNNVVKENVAGIEIENTLNAECYGNLVTNNTAGILVFDLPDLPKKNGGYIRVYNNEVTDNNFPNFSSLGISVSMLPSGVGLLFMACKHVEAYGNQVVNNQSVGTIICNLDQMGRKTQDSLYNKYPSAIYIHDNYYERSQVVPDTSRSLGKMLYSLFETNLPIIFFDGYQDPALMADGGVVPSDQSICVVNNENASFYNMATKSTDMSVHNCTQQSLSPVQLNGVEVPKNL